MFDHGRTTELCVFMSLNVVNRVTTASTRTRTGAMVMRIYVDITNALYKEDYYEDN